MWDWPRVFNGHMRMHKYLRDWTDFLHGRIEESIEREREKARERETFSELTNCQIVFTRVNFDSKFLFCRNAAVVLEF